MIRKDRFQLRNETRRKLVLPLLWMHHPDSILLPRSFLRFEAFLESKPAEIDGLILVQDRVLVHWGVIDKAMIVGYHHPKTMYKGAAKRQC